MLTSTYRGNDYWSKNEHENNIPHHGNTRIWSDLNSGKIYGEITYLMHADRADGPDGRPVDQIDLN
jgi:hypothetical protein